MSFGHADETLDSLIAGYSLPRESILTCHFHKGENFKFCFKGL